MKNCVFPIKAASCLFFFAGQLILSGMEDSAEVRHALAFEEQIASLPYKTLEPVGTPQAVQLPSGWHRGFNHYHTAFHYPAPCTVSPAELASRLREIGASFAFCAGDHTSKHGTGWWDWRKYYPLCHEGGASDVVLMPAMEKHLCFQNIVPPESSRYRKKWENMTKAGGKAQHHTVVPSMDIPSSMGEENPEKVFEGVKKQGSSLVINHPFCHMAAGHPDPLLIPLLYRFDYFEFFTGVGFLQDLRMYLEFLSDPRSCRMGCCAGQDNDDGSIHPKEMSSQFTHLYAGPRFSRESLMEAWNMRRSYASHGHLYFEKLSPVPSILDVKTRDLPVIEFEVKNSAGKAVSKVEIYRNGKRVYEGAGEGHPSLRFRWQDPRPESENHYIIHIEAGPDHLVTSPMNVLFISSAKFVGLNRLW
ncbi:MAG: hypothetical protein PHV34_02060 [Verrucomicrobiae bacterium]|nr:hypothetical protein [Verrucomicrobiae bacterium]